MAETATPKTPVIASGTALTDHNAHVHEFEVNYTCALKRTATLTLVNGDYTDITFPTGSAIEIADPLNWHSMSANTERITVNRNGLYRFDYLFKVHDNNIQSIDFLIELKKNGDTVVFDITSKSAASLNYIFSGSAYINLTSGDYVISRIYHEGGAIDLLLLANQGFFSATLLR